MDPKSAVGKSKSSNSAITSKDSRPSRPNKKTRSNADVIQPVVKKRGVYVEKKLTKISLESHDKTDDTKTQKAPKRAGQKEFLTSVLTILSKPTTGTQYPEIPDDINEFLTKNGKTKKAGYSKRTKEKDDGKDIENRIKTTRKRLTLKDDESASNSKYKSRVLNKKFVREDKKKMVVLQSKKDIAQTPSNYSEWSYKDAAQSNSSNLVINDVEGRVANELANAVMQGRNPKIKKLRYLEEPNTLVSDEPKDEKKLYNFFVDLLETTISVYNVKAEYDANDVSKVDLQINESVADKLNIDKCKAHDITTKPSVTFNIQDSDENDVKETYDMKPITIKPDLIFKTNKPRKLKADSFTYAKRKKSIPPKSKSVEINHKKLYRNKNDLINVLKQELEGDFGFFEEPQNLYQALKVMARNKKKTIHFDTKVEQYKFTDTDECFLKGRKVISTRKMKKHGKKDENDQFSKSKLNSRVAKKDYQYVPRKKTKNVRYSDKTESYHSLEVYGFDYETIPSKNPVLNAKKDVTFTYHSSPSNSELDFNVYDAILNPDSEISIRNFNAI